MKKKSGVILAVIAILLGLGAVAAIIDITTNNNLSVSNSSKPNTSEPLSISSEEPVATIDESFDPMDYVFDNPYGLDDYTIEDGKMFFTSVDGPKNIVEKEESNKWILKGTIEVATDMIVSNYIGVGSMCGYDGFGVYATFSALEAETDCKFNNGLELDLPTTKIVYSIPANDYGYVISFIFIRDNYNYYLSLDNGLSYLTYVDSTNTTDVSRPYFIGVESAVLTNTYCTFEESLVDEAVDKIIIETASEESVSGIIYEDELVTDGVTWSAPR